MPTPPAGYAEIVVKLSTPIVGKFATWTFGVKLNAGWVVTNFHNWLIGNTGNNYRAHLCSPYGIVSWDLITSAGTTTTPVNLAGANAVTTLPPPAVALLVKKITGNPGHSMRGRCYWPGMLAESEVDNGGIVLAAAITAEQLTATALLTALTAGNMPMYLFHRSGATPTAVTSFVVQTVVATQRRRQR